MGEAGREALLEFVDELRRLRQLAGAPSLNELVAVAARLQQPLARSTLSDKLNAKSLPEWHFVAAYVSACSAHAEQVGVPLPAELTDLARWDAEHWRLLRAADGVRAGERLSGAAHTEVGRRASRAEQPKPSAPEHPRIGDGSIVPRQLPAAVRHFAGRAPQVAALTELLAESAGAPGTVLISAIGGTAGVGKTALALHWAHGVADRFPDGQLYVNLRGFDATGSMMSPAEAMRGFLEALGVPAERVPAGLTAQAALYRSLLVGRRMLVLLDNARDADQVRPLLPGSSGCLVVVTSRNQLPGLVAAEGAHPLLLDLLPAAESLELLSRRLGDRRVAREPAAVDRIVASSAGLPLALSIVAARAATHPDFGLARLADELEGTRGSLDGFTGGEAGADVRAVLSWSYRGLDPATARLFRLLGLHPGPDLSVPAAASLAGLPVADVRAPLANLTRANLLAEPLPGRYALHDLLRAYALEQVDANDPDQDRRDALTRLFDHYLHTAHGADLLLYHHRDSIDVPAVHDGVATIELRDRDHAWACLGAEHRALLAATALAAGTGFETHAWQLACTLNTYLDRLGAWQDQSGVQRLALEAATRSGDRLGQARVHRNRAVACLRLGSYDEAGAHLRQSLDLYGQLGDDVGSARTQLNLGILAERQGDYRQALDHAQRAFDLFEGAGHGHGAANALNNIGWYHIQLGDHRRALGYCERALAEQQRTGNRYWQAHTWDSLGYAHHHLGHHREAVECYEHALALWQEAGERYFEATTLTHLGDTHHGVGDVDRAGSAWRQAADILDRLGHPDAEQVWTKLRPDANSPS
ncbi:ATP-binding protein [Micromonospora sp. NBC_01796]|uniref:ATP-binding protein n=1 Tax=Micromonospora sp. NBC_01796 TaxID=2975987 RepID=UPI002DD8B1BD|nr:tetratricopeptide repeat protein [Micromonospora sp. NBC_01796]WSA84303.1 tetratricopeptide repeat protein [Micromonospora sp. NBC_01796]